MIADFEHHEEGCGPTKEIAAPTLSTSNGYLNIEGGKYRVVQKTDLPGKKYVNVQRADSFGLQYFNEA